MIGRAIRTGLRGALLLALLSGAPLQSAYAWGDEGHEIVALIADQYLAPAVRLRVQQLLAQDHSGLVADDSIALEATWADRYRDSDRTGSQLRYRQTRAWHFVDLELSAPSLSQQCPVRLAADESASQGPANDCVVDKIEQFRRELKAADTTDAERVLALQFVLHFVGDEHQPLHASDDHDQGGNAKSVSAPGLPAANLHHYWDTEFVQQLGHDPVPVAQTLLQDISPGQRSRWRRGTAADWARESYRVARRSAYAPLPTPAADGRYALTSAYVRQATACVSLQLRRAGVRLAQVLNDALAEKPARTAAVGASIDVSVRHSAGGPARRTGQRQRAAHLPGLGARREGLPAYRASTELAARAGAARRT